MLKNNFYTILSLAHQDSSIKAALQLNAGHRIFAGHFPGQPVVPGACMLQIVREVLSHTLKSDPRLKKADNLKFIAPIDPLMTDELTLGINYKIIETVLQVNAVICANSVTCFKMQATFTES
jgi:3-hydroxyacyl-[acyl-carrier-protein] dehydratase